MTKHDDRLLLSRARRGRGRRLGRHPAVVLATATALVSACLAAVSVTTSSAATTVVPATFFTVPDSGGANDVPAQSDLTQMGRDEAAAGYYKLFWSWDSTDQWSGSGQTGDACALFNLDGDSAGKVDAVVCGQVTNPGGDTSKVVQNHAPYVFRCDGAKTDRCSQPSAPLLYNPATLDVLAGAMNDPKALLPAAGRQDQNLITDTDPFGSLAPNGPGSNHPNDATLQVNISKAYLATLATSKGPKWPTIPNPTPTLVNVCSYPSAGNGGNNNPFDCVVAPGSGFIKVVKNAPVAANWTFTATNLPSTSYTVSTSAATGTGSTSNIGVVAGANKSLTESATTGWSLTSAACSYPTTTGTSSTGTRSGSTVSGIEVKVGLLTTCTFTNARDTGSIVVQKVDDDLDPLTGASFAVRLDGSTGDGTAMTHASGGVFCVDGLPTGGTYDVLETAAPTGYAAAGAIQDVTVSGASTCAQRLAATTVVVDRQVQNLREHGAIVIHKQDPAGDALAGAAFTATLNGSSDDPLSFVESGDGIFCLDGLPTGGTYSIEESTVPLGYSQTTTPDDVTVAEAATCAARLADEADVPDLTITNSPVNADLSIEKTDDRGVALPGAEFTLYVDSDEDGVHDDTELDTYGDPVVTDAEGFAVFENVEPGSYCVVESGTPTGHTTADAQCIEVGLGTEAGQGDDQTLVFENVRTHRVVVLVCHEGTDTLAPVDVALGGQTKTSLAAGSLTAAQQKALCDLDGASFGGLEHAATPQGLSVSLSGH